MKTANPLDMPILVTVSRRETDLRSSATRGAQAGWRRKEDPSRRGASERALIPRYPKRESDETGIARRCASAPAMSASARPRRMLQQRVHVGLAGVGRDDVQEEAQGHQAGSRPDEPGGREDDEDGGRLIEQENRQNPKAEGALLRHELDLPPGLSGVAATANSPRRPGLTRRKPPKAARVLAQRFVATGMQRILARSRRSPGRMPASKAGEFCSATKGPCTSVTSPSLSV